MQQLFSSKLTHIQHLASHIPVLASPSAGSYGASPDGTPGSMNSIERVSIPMQDLCPDPCLPPARLNPRPVKPCQCEHFCQTMLSPEDRVSGNGFAQSMLSLEAKVSRTHEKNACAVCGLCRGALLRGRSPLGNLIFLLESK